MSTRSEVLDPDAAATQLQREYAGSEVCVADLLCDRHAPQDKALTVVADDLSVRRWTFGELREASERVARGLSELGVGQGDCVATLMGKGFELVVTQLAVWRLGAVYVPLFTAFGPGGIAHRLGDAGAAAVVCDPTQRPKLEPGEDIPADAPWTIVTTGDAPPARDASFAALLESEPETAPVAVGGDGIAMQLYTSGTTGKAKAVPIPARAFASFHAYAKHGLDIRPSDVYWNAADPGWGYGLYYGIVAPLLMGHPVMLLASRFSAELAWRTLADLSVTNFAAAPTALRAMRATGRTADLELRCVSTAGEPLDADLVEWGHDAFGVPVRDHYGQTEHGMVIADGWHPDVRHDVRPGSMGHPLPGWTVRVLATDSDDSAPDGEYGRVVIDVGESPLMWFRGYRDNPEKTAERFSDDGRWYLTGDIARRDEDGSYFFSSRDDDVILMAGYRIGPYDVESVLQNHHAVVEAAVCAVPDPERGEIMVAFVVLQPGSTAPETLSEELKQMVKTRYAAHAYPRHIFCIGELPKTASGKVIRRQLRGTAKAELRRVPAVSGVVHRV